MKKLRLVFWVMALMAPGNLSAGFYVGATGAVSTSPFMTLGVNSFLLPFNAMNAMDGRDTYFVPFTRPPVSFGAVAGVNLWIFRMESEYSYLVGRNADLHLNMLNLYLRQPKRGGGYIGFGFGGARVDRLKNRYANDNLVGNHAIQVIIGVRAAGEDSPMFVDIEWRGVYVELESLGPWGRFGPEYRDLWQNEFRIKLGVQF